MQEKSIVIWGSGKIGRGFIADLFDEAGYRITFVDANSSLIEQMQKNGSYSVMLAPSAQEQSIRTIKCENVLHTQDTKIQQILAEASLIALAVFAQALDDSLSHIAKAVEQRATQVDTCPLDIMLCMNIVHPKQLVLEKLNRLLSERGKKFLDEQVGIIETLIIRMAVETPQEMKTQDPLRVLTNGYTPLIIDAQSCKTDLCSITGIRHATNFEAEELRKLYTYNMIHAVYAYGGALYGLQTIMEAIQTPMIQTLAVEALNEVKEALMCEYGFTEDEMNAWNADVLKNMANPMLKDSIRRVGFDPIRKVARQDRLTGPALLCRKHGIFPYALYSAIACAYQFFHEEDSSSKELQTYVSQHGINNAIQTYSQLFLERDALQTIAECYESIAKKKLTIDVHRDLYKAVYRAGFMNEKTYKGCAQCTVKAFIDVFHSIDEAVFDACSAFCGGMGLCGDGSCGAYAGGLLIMGSFIGRRLQRLADGDRQAKYQSFDMAQRLHDRFIATYGSTICRDIHTSIFGSAYCLRYKEEREAFEEVGAHVDKCTTVVAIACVWIAQILLEESVPLLLDGR